MGAAAEAAAQAHEEQLKAATVRYEELLAQLKAKEEELESTHAVINEVNKGAAAAAEQHFAKLEEMEKGYQTTQAEMAEKIVSISTELEVRFVTLMCGSRLKTWFIVARVQVQREAGRCQG